MIKPTVQEQAEKTSTPNLFDRYNHMNLQASTPPRPDLLTHMSSHNYIYIIVETNHGHEGNRSQIRYVRLNFQKHIKVVLFGGLCTSPSDGDCIIHEAAGAAGLHACVDQADPT
jgi:hypothetical protein